MDLFIGFGAGIISTWMAMKLLKWGKEIDHKNLLEEQTARKYEEIVQEKKKMKKNENELDKS